MIQTNKLIENDRSLFLNYTHGFDFGPIDFNINNMDPNYLLYIATNGKFNGVILNRGIAELYQESYVKKVPLILKVNGKTNLTSTNHVAETCSVSHAVKLHADALAYTLLIGSPYEHEMLKQYSKILDDAHDYGLPVVTNIRAAGKNVQDGMKTSMIAYCARTGLELGSDFVSIDYNGILEEFKWVIHCAGKARILVNDGNKTQANEILKRIFDLTTTDTKGIIVGKEIFQNQKPLKLVEGIRSIMFEGKNIAEALELVEE